MLRVAPAHIELPPTTPQPISFEDNQFTGAALVVVHVAVACIVHNDDVAHRALLLGGSSLLRQREEVEMSQGRMLEGDI